MIFTKSGGAAVLSEYQAKVSGLQNVQPGIAWALPDRVRYAVYSLALAVSISVWFLAIRAPLWLDETISFFIVKGKFSELLSRQGWPGVPAYPALLWLWVRATGSGEITLRLSSVLAMLAATYVLYRAARELFDTDVAIIAAVIFCLHPNVIFASIDIRPYPFAAVAISTTLYALIRLRKSDSRWIAALFGFSAASIVYFQFLFSVILPAFALSLFALRLGDRKIQWRQLGLALGVFAIAILPAVPGVRYLLTTSGTHVFSVVPAFLDLRQTLVQKRVLYPFIAIGLIAVGLRKLDLRRRFDTWAAVLCVSMTLVPIVILYGVSVETSIHIFVERYRLVAIPGLALCWAFVANRITSHGLRLLFCVAVVVSYGFVHFKPPLVTSHDYSWKYALDVLRQNASVDQAPIVLCSDLPESDFMTMPSSAAAKDSAIFAPLSYYPLSGPVVALPRALNDQARRAGSLFLRSAVPPHARFLAAAFMPSYDTLDWLVDSTDGTHSVQELGVFDGVRVLEFDPISPIDGSR